MIHISEYIDFFVKEISEQVGKFLWMAIPILQSIFIKNCLQFILKHKKSESTMVNQDVYSSRKKNEKKKESSAMKQGSNLFSYSSCQRTFIIWEKSNFDFDSDHMYNTGNLCCSIKDVIILAVSSDNSQIFEDRDSNIIRQSDAAKLCVMTH